MANIGITLRSTRIQRGLTIEQVAQDTRISARFLEALENEAFDELPAPVYVRGFLRSYANYLHLDPQPFLSQLSAADGGAYAKEPVTGGEPAAPKPSSDPFRPSPPARPRVVGQHDPLRPTTRAPRTDPFSSRRPEPETPLDPANVDVYRGRVGGVLLERGAVYDDNGRAARIVALAGGGFVLLVVMALAAVAFGGGGDGGDDDSVLAGDGLTPGPGRTQTIIVAGSATGQASSSRTVASGETPVATATGATATPGGTTPGSTAESSTPTPQPTTEPTPTPVPPTPTPVPPTPTPTPPPPGHGSAFSECPKDSSAQPDCGSPMTIVCVPGTGDWFVDYENDFPAAQYEWPSIVVTKTSDAINRGYAGCV